MSQYNYGQPQATPYPQPHAQQYVSVPPGFGYPGPDGTVPLNQPWYGVGFMEANKRYFKKYIRFNGFASRGEYWWSFLGLTLIGLIPSVIFAIGYIMVFAGIIGAAASASYDGSGAGGAVASGLGLILLIVGGGLTSLISFATLLPSLGLAIRRLHDAGYSGWWYLLAFVPFGSIVVLVFLVMPTNPEKWQADWFDTSEG